MQVWHSFTLTRCNVVLYNMPEAKSSSEVRLAHWTIPQSSVALQNPGGPLENNKQASVGVCCLLEHFVRFVPTHVFVFSSCACACEELSLHQSGGVENDEQSIRGKKSHSYLLCVFFLARLSMAQLGWD